MDYMNNKTRWVVKINDQKNKRVLIEYFPLKNKFIFSGQLKVAEIWYTFSIRKVKLGEKVIEYSELEKIVNKTEYITVNDVDIDDNILKVYAELEDKIVTYLSFTEMMKEYKDIKIAEDDAINKEEK